MGRLFWKFFLFLWLAQFMTAAGVGGMMWLKHRDSVSAMEGRDAPPPSGARHLPPHPDMEGRPPPRRGRPVFPPLMPLLAGGVVSLIFAAWLAWYFSKPIRCLRGAFEDAAGGHLERRITPEMGGRRDELADLGRDFDGMAQRLQNLVDGQKRLLHDVSHEMRSPLARLQAAIGLARRQPDKLEDSMARIERESVRMDRLVSELLTLSRLEAGMAGKLDEEVDLSELLANVVDDARFEAEASGCRVEFDARGDAMVRGNAELLHRAVENVVRNALKHSPAGGLISVEVGVIDDGRAVAISVSDEGNGVPENDLQAIFEPFFRGNQSLAADGHGLGLAISQRVILAHRGSVIAANRAAGGLCITLSLPFE